MLAELLKSIISWLWFANGWSKWVIPNLRSFLMQRPWEILVSGAHQCSAASLSRKAPDRWRGKKGLVMAFADALSKNRRMNDDKPMIQFVYPRLSKHLKKCPKKKSFNAHPRCFENHWSLIIWTEGFWKWCIWTLVSWANPTAWCCLTY